MSSAGESRNIWPTIDPRTSAVRPYGGGSPGIDLREKPAYILHPRRSDNQFGACTEHRVGGRRSSGSHLQWCGRRVRAGHVPEIESR